MKINILFTLLLARFYQVENIKSITYLTVSQMPWVQQTYQHTITQYWPIFFIFIFFFEIKGTKNLTTPYSIPYLSVLHQNKSLHNFHKRGQPPTVRHIKGLDQGLVVHSNMVGAKTGVATCINEIESIRHIAMVTLFS